MSETVERLKGLLERGTAKPWAATTRQGSWDWLIFAPGTPFEVCQMFHDGTEGNEEGEANAELIVAAVNALPGLIACAEACEWYAMRDWPFLLRDDVDSAMRKDGHDMSAKARAALATLTK